MDSNDIKISAAIPLYNKAGEIGRTIDSVLSQTVLPMELLIVDDGSTDGSVAVVSSISSPLVRLIRQPNAGVSAARNRAAKEASGDYIAFLDGDDMWRPGYLEKMRQMIMRHPGCGAYSAAFDIVSSGKTYPNNSPAEEGILPDFFCTALRKFICQPSATIIPKYVFDTIGGFPEGMKIGEDLYMWIKIASRYPVCFTPSRLVEYNRTASNRSLSTYKPEETPYSFEDFYRPEEGNSCRNEYVARCAINKAISLCAKGDIDLGRRTEQFFSYTHLFRRDLCKLKVLNRIPAKLRPRALSFYNDMAWLLAKKGF